MSKTRMFWVAPTGNDSNPGTEQQPFATLHRARDAAREERGAVTVHVRGGTYYLAEPLTLTPEDSGTADAPIRYEACPGEEVVLSGAAKLDLNWQPHENGILKANIPPSTLDTRHSALPFDQLFVNGTRQRLARYPSYDPDDPTAKGKGVMPVGQTFGDHPTTELEFYTAPEGGFLPSAEWKHPEEAILHVRWFLGQQIFRLRGIDFGRKRFLLGRGGWHWNSRIFPMEGEIRFSRAHIENVFEELTDPGEWYYDKREHVLYYMPEERLATVSPSNCPADSATSLLEGSPVRLRRKASTSRPNGNAKDVLHPLEGEASTSRSPMAAALIEVPRLRQLIELRGSQDNPVRHVSFSGFRFTHTTTVFMEPWEAPSMGDWTIHRSGAFYMNGAEDCAVENSVFHATGGNAVMMDGYNVRNRVSGCTFTETGESAVCLVGYNMKRLGTARPFPDECVVHNNHMHHLGEYQTQVAGVFLSCCQKTTVSHNDIHDVPRAAVLVNDPTWGGHVIEYNRLYRTCLDSTDHGPFNSWGRTRHWCFNRLHGPDHPSHSAGRVEDDALFVTELRYNYIEELRGNFGVDQDDGTCRMRIHHNVLVGCPIKFQCGTDSVAENNIIIDPTLATRMAMVNEYNTDRFVRNIVVARKDMPLGSGYGVSLEQCPRHFYHAVQGPVEGPLLQEIDHNLFWSDDGEFRACVTQGDHGKRTGNGTETDVLSLTEWQALGYDRHSVFADPQFVGEANGDFRLQPDSPAHALGIEGVSMERWGLVPEFAGERP